MAHEIELKLALGTDTADLLHSHPLLAGITTTRRHLRNTYFDTPDGRLEANAAALRLRDDGQHYIQTLKTRGHSEGGLSRRGEWEWELSTPTLDIGLLEALPALASLSHQQLLQLKAIFTTDFQRDTWLIDYAGSQVEVALDQGNICTDTTPRRVRICELELELKQGDSSALMQVAETLAEQVPVRPSDTSKAERGNHLRGHPWQLPPHSAPLQRALVALDALNDTEQPQWLAQARQALETLADSSEADVRQSATVLLKELDHSVGLPDWSLHCGQQAMRLIRQLAGQ